MADGDASIPGWTGAQEGSADWNTCILGDAIIPGLVTVEDLEVGIDIDTKKCRGQDRPTSTDNGLRPTRFKLRVWLKESDWPEFQRVAPSFQPRRPGRERQPLQIIHPLVNFLGITEVRVAGIKAQSPTARVGLVIHILCEEWFDKPVATKKKEDAAVPANPANARNDNAVNLGLDAAQRDALNIARQQGLREMSEQDIDPVTGQPLKPSDPDALKRGMFPPLGT